MHVVSKLINARAADRVLMREFEEIQLQVN